MSGRNNVRSCARNINNLPYRVGRSSQNKKFASVEASRITERVLSQLRLRRGGKRIADLRAHENIPPILHPLLERWVTSLDKSKTGSRAAGHGLCPCTTDARARSGRKIERHGSPYVCPMRDRQRVSRPRPHPRRCTDATFARANTHEQQNTGPPNMHKT